MIRIWCCAALFAASTFTFTSARADYAVTTVHRLGADETYFSDINSAGQVAGSSVADGTASSFVWSAGSFTPLAGPAGSVSSEAFGISDGGTVVGYYLTSPDSFFQGYLYTAGSYQTFSVAGAAATVLRGISADGRWLSGFYGDDTLRSAFVFDRTNSILTTLPGEVVTRGVNSAGIVAGSRSGGLPFLFDGATGTSTDFALPRHRFRDINDSGFVVGFRSTFLGVVPIYGSPSAFQDLDLGEGLFSGQAFGTNNAGWIVGYAFDESDAPTAFIASPQVAAVPEPEVAALLACGLLLIGARSRRRARLQSPPGRA